MEHDDPIIDLYPYLEDAHPAVVDLLRWFEHDHLPPHLQDVVSPFHLLAHCMAANSETDIERLTEASKLSTDFGVLAGSPLAGAELTVALRKLLESKDAAVRACLLGNGS